MLPFDEIPPDALSWLVISLVFIAVALRSSYTYRKTKNRFSFSTSLVAPFAAAGYFFWGITLLFTTDIELIKTSILIGDLLILIAIAIHVYLFWFIYLQKRFTLVQAIIPTVVVALAAAWDIVNRFLNDGRYAFFDDEGTFFIQELSYFLIIYFIVFFYPISINFMRLALTEKSKKLKSFIMGLLYFLIATVEIIVIGFRNEQPSGETIERVLVFITLIIFGLSFFIYRLISNYRK